MQRLQTLQPEIKKIQERYKDDKQRMNQEVMAFYQREKVNPLGSCFPLLLQIPFFISLFYLLRSDEFKADIADNPGFLAIDNLAEKVTDPVLLGVADRALRRHAARGERGHGDQRRPDAAPDHVRAAVRVRDLHHQLRGRADPLLDHHERLDDRAAAAREEALSEAGAARPARTRCRAEARAREAGARRAAGGRRRRRPAARPSGSAKAAGEGRRRPAAATAPRPRRRRGSPRKKKKRSGRRR